MRVYVMMIVGPVSVWPYHQLMDSRCPSFTWIVSVERTD